MKWDFYFKMYRFSIIEIQITGEKLKWQLLIGQDQILYYERFDLKMLLFESYRGKGYATEMILMVLRFFFLELAYQKLNTTD